MSEQSFLPEPDFNVAVEVPSSHPNPQHQTPKLSDDEGPAPKLADPIALGVVNPTVGSSTNGDLPVAIEENDNGKSELCAAVTEGVSGQATKLTLNDVLSVVCDGTKLFHDSLGDAFAEFNVAAPRPHRETSRICRKSPSFAGWMRSRIRQRYGVFLPNAAINTVTELLEHQGQIGPTIPLSNRFAIRDEKLYLDLLDDMWRVVEVTSTNWKVIQPDRPIFWRNRHQLPLPVPVSGGSLDALFEFVPVDNKHERLLLVTWSLAALHPDISKPILMQKGQPGSAKTTRSRILRSLIDPSRTPVLGELERTNLTQVVYHHAVPCFDNLGRFSRAEADFFCRAVTGVGIERRKLYTDADQILYEFRRPIILNGLDVPTHRPDFLDRCLVLHSERIRTYQSEATLTAEFERARPKLLGALLDHLVRTLLTLPMINPPTEFRMADFGRFGRAVAQAMGRPQNDFDEAYRTVRQQFLEDAMDDDPVARAIVSYLEGDSLKDSAEVVLSLLVRHAKTRKWPIDPREWPKNGRWFSTRVDELTPMLASKGIVVRRHPRTNKGRVIEIVRG